MLVLCSSGWLTLLEQHQHDKNFETLLQAMHEAFDFSHHEDTLKSIKSQSEQARILTLMLQDVCSCCDFIQYGGMEGKTKLIKDLSDVLVKRRKAFLDQATISMEITAFQILDDMAKISTDSDTGR